MWHRRPGSTPPAMPAERAAPAATLLEADPQAPTLCVGWRVVDLLAHLVLREHRPDLMLRDGLSGAEPGGEPHLQRAVADALDADGHPDLVVQLEARPPALAPPPPSHVRANLQEYGGEPHLQRVVADALDADGYADLVVQLEAGPPRLSPLRAFDVRANLLEYVIHHEDVRRGPRGADGVSAPAEPRDDVSPALSV